MFVLKKEGIRSSLEINIVATRANVYLESTI